MCAVKAFAHLSARATPLPIVTHRERFPGIISISEETYDFALTGAFQNAIDNATRDAGTHRANRAAAPNTA